MHIRQQLAALGSLSLLAVQNAVQEAARERAPQPAPPPGPNVHSAIGRRVNPRPIRIVSDGNVPYVRGGYKTAKRQQRKEDRRVRTSFPGKRVVKGERRAG